MGCGAETEANAVMTALLTGVDFTLPTVDLTDPVYQLPSSSAISGPITQLTNADLTTKTIGGTGTFDVLMSALSVHLQDQFDKNRITGEQYSKVYIALTEGAMSQAVQFLIQRDNAYWSAVTAQQQALAAQAAAITARVQLETAKVQLRALQFEAKTQEATYALTKMKLASESIAYCTGKYQLDFLLPAQLTMVKEQAEAQRAQTMDTRSDGVTQVTGSVGKQKELYAQQVTSYKRDAETKVAKIFTDAWITQKTIDEGLLPPNGFTNASIDTILTKLKTVNQLT